MDSPRIAMAMLGAGRALRADGRRRGGLFGWLARRLGWN